MNYALQNRLRMIDFLLAHFGYFNRKHLMDYFGLSQPQVSADIAEYRKLFPGNCDYLKSTRQYTVLPTFKRGIE